MGFWNVVGDVAVAGAGFVGGANPLVGAIASGATQYVVSGLEGKGWGSGALEEAAVTAGTTLIGGGIGKGISLLARGAKGFKAGTKALDDAKIADEALEGAGKAKDAAQKAVTEANEKMYDAAKSVREADKRFRDAEDEVTRLSGRDKKDPEYKRAVEEKKEAKKALREANTAYDKAEDAWKTAKNTAVPEAQKKFGEANVKAYDAQQKSDEIMSKSGYKYPAKYLKGDEGGTWKDDKWKLFLKKGGLGQRVLSAGGAGLGSQYDSGTAEEPAVTGQWIGQKAAGDLWGNETTPFINQAAHYGNPIQSNGSSQGFLFVPEPLSPQTDKWCADLSETVVQNWRLAGNENKAEPVANEKIPQMASSVPDLSGETLKNYQTNAAGLNSVAEEFDKVQEDLGKIVPTSGEGAAKIDEAMVEKARTQFRENLKNLVENYNTSATSSAGKDDQFAEMTAQAFKAVGVNTEDAAGQNQDAAGQTDDLTERFKALEERLNNQQAQTDQKLKDAVAEATKNADNADTGQTGNDTGLGLNDGLGNLNDTNPNDTGAGAGLNDTAGRTGADAGLGGTAGAGVGDPGATVPTSTPYEAAGMGSAMTDSMLPFMLSGMMGNNPMGAGLLDDTYDDTGHSHHHDPAAVMPPSLVAPPLPATPGTPGTPDAGAGSNQSQQQQAGPQPGASATPGGTGTPNRVPGPDGAVVYTFPDGRTQKVSPIVATALDAAFANSAGTDAKAAYGKTSVKWESEKKPGERTDAFKVMTGDVSKWDNVTAILVAFPGDSAGSGGTLEVIIHGQLQVFNQDMSGTQTETGNRQSQGQDGKVPGSQSGSDSDVPGSQSGQGSDVPGSQSGSDSSTPKGKGDVEQSGPGAFGDWVGFFHPAGIEIVAPNTSVDQQTTAGSTPVPADQGTAAAAVPMAVAPS